MAHVYALAVFFAAMTIAAVAADVDQWFRDRYARLADHADQGIGLDEFEGDRRFTRPTDKTKAPVPPAKKNTGADDQNNHKEN